MASRTEMEASSGPDPTGRFSDRVDDYVKARPRYPAGVLVVLRERIGFSPDWVVADVGSGTGISAELFLNHGNRVFAVEPNDAMRSAAEAMLAANPSFRSINGTAEATSLADASVDLAVAAQAFHWFNLPGFRRECRRILRPGRWVLLMWNDRLLTGSPFLDGYERLLQLFATDYKTVNHQNLGIDPLTEFFGAAPELMELPNEQQLDFDGLQARLLSSSYVPNRGHPRLKPMLAALRDLFDATQAGGRVSLRYRTQLFLGRLV